MCDEVVDISIAMTRARGLMASTSSCSAASPVRDYRELPDEWNPFGDSLITGRGS